MRSASIQLTTFVKSVTAEGSSARGKGEEFEAFQRRLRHDLRSPLNVIKGYSELLLEDMEADKEQPLRADLTKLRDSANRSEERRVGKEGRSRWALSESRKERDNN